MNSVHTRPVEGIPKKIAIKFKKLKKTLSGVIFSENGVRQAKKERKKFQSRIPFTLDPGKRIPKKIEKMEKPLCGIIFSHNGMKQAEKEGKKFQTRIPFILDPCQEIPKKKAKKFKKLKKPFPALFLAKTG